MKTAPQKLLLIHALPLNCTGGNCFQNGRGSISALCSICDGTGYLTGSQSGGAAQKPPFSQAPYATSVFIYGDLQQGHGLYGAGGDFLKLIADLGKQDVGDGTLFCKMWDFNQLTGEIVYPVVDATLPRPDIIVSVYGQPYNIIREMIAEVGNEQIARIFSVEKGSFSSMSNGGR